MLIAITHYRTLNSNDIAHVNNISSHIDYLLLRTPMSDTELTSFINHLMNSGFPKEKLMIHSSIELLEAFQLTAIHFRETDTNAFKYKLTHPEIAVSISAHSSGTIKKAQLNHLDFVLFGHVFKSQSKKSLPPRTFEEIDEALSFNIPVIALGGINLETIRFLPSGFSGISAISAFMNRTSNQVMELRKEWHKLDST